MKKIKKFFGVGNRKAHNTAELIANKEGNIKLEESQPKISKKKSLGEHKDDLSLRSINQKEFLTENIAKIYIRQKKIKDAIKIYEKLMSLNSKKKSYFAKKIEKLKK